MKSNPHLKRILIEVVDNQLRDNLERLISLGYSEKQAKEKIAAVVVGDIYDVMKENKPHDTVKYEQQLRALK